MNEDARTEFQFGFTGTRHGLTHAQRLTLRLFMSQATGILHHGDCIGADSDAHDIAEECGYRVILHPPTDPKMRAWRKVAQEDMRPERPYLARNRDIVDETEQLIACPCEMKEQTTGGTWSTVRYARKRSKLIVLIKPDGSIEQSLQTPLHSVRDPT